MVRRFAFSMIELVFAIVIISISVISLPMMTQVISENSENALVQEAVFAAATELSEATSFQWDANVTEATTTASSVINVNNDCNATTHLRPGHIPQPLHRKCLDDLTVTPSNIASNALPNIHNQAHASQALFLGDATTEHGYKNAYNSTLSIAPNSSFGALANNPNIKKMSVEVTNSDGDVVTKLETFTFNIGEVDIYKRRL